MHVLNVKRQGIVEIIFQKGDHLVTRAANREKKMEFTNEKECPLNTDHCLSKFQSLENITCMCPAFETCP